MHQKNLALMTATKGAMDTKLVISGQKKIVFPTYMTAKVSLLPLQKAARVL